MSPSNTDLKGIVLVNKALKRHGLYLRLTKVFAITGLILILVSYTPSVWYFVAARAGIEYNSKLIEETVVKANPAPVRFKVSDYQPAKDPSLPKQNTLILDTTGINTEIHEAQDVDYEEALRKGVWRVPDFGTPFDRSKPLILAAHRFGYLKWSIPYRLRNSFYNLPKLKIGDTVEIVWNQRKYTYAVYGEEKGELIGDYEADLILYTCEDLNSNVRIFKYSKLLEI
jgi:sortase (surface protein transpeptidase)